MPKVDKAKRREEAAQMRRQAAELELLLLDEGNLGPAAPQGDASSAAFGVLPLQPESQL